MAEQAFVYKSNQRFSNLPSCSFDIEYLKKLYNIMSEKNIEAANLEIGSLKKAPAQTDEDFSRLKEYLKSLYKVTIEMTGSQGEYIFSESPDILNKESLPDRINSVVFDNSVKYNFELKKDPSNKLKISFDFRKVPIFDLITSPSLPSSNDNYINVVGINETWVDGANRKIIESLKGRSNRRGWLHRRNVYDLLVWFAFIPVSFWTIYRLESIYKINHLGVSPFLMVFAYFYFFLFILNIFRVVFNYSRWVFPYNELDAKQDSASTAHRFILFTLFLSIIGSFVYDIVKICLSKLL